MIQNKCKCGCGKEIIIKAHHKKYGIPKFIHGHNNNRKGIKLSDDIKRKISQNSAQWTGENYSYQALHKRIRKKLGKPIICEECGSIDNLQWANKSGEYKFEITDWIPLCVICHRKLDKGRNSIKLVFPEFYKK